MPFRYSMCDLRFPWERENYEPSLCIVLLREYETTALKCFSCLNSFILDMGINSYHIIKLMYSRGHVYCLPI